MEGRPGRRVLRATRIGLGGLEALRIGGEGRILAWFPRACYLEASGGLIALVGPDVHDGPLYVVLAEALPRRPRGEPVRLSPQGVDGRSWGVSVGDARVWRGFLPSPDRMAAAVPLLVEAAAPIAARSLLPARARLPSRQRLAAGELEGVAASLAGLGPGLTPSGDDVLAGVLFGLRALRGRGGEDHLWRVAAEVTPTPVSTAFIRWAARGQALGPVHELLRAAIGGNAPAAEAAAEALGRVGESSGADFMLGLLWAMETVTRRPSATGSGLEALDQADAAVERRRRESRATPS